jgi:hypothetical protein
LFEWFVFDFTTRRYIRDSYQKLSKRYSGKQKIVLNLKQEGDEGIVGPMAALYQRDRTERIIQLL